MVKGSYSSILNIILSQKTIIRDLCDFSILPQKSRTILTLIQMPALFAEDRITFPLHQHFPSCAGGKLCLNLAICLSGVQCTLFISRALNKWNYDVITFWLKKDEFNLRITNFYIMQRSKYRRLAKKNNLQKKFYLVRFVESIL